MRTKVCIYQSLVLSVLYAGETWTLLAADIKTLEALHVHYQCRFLDIRWFDWITNTTVPSTTGLPTIGFLLQNSQLSLFDHH